MKTAEEWADIFVPRTQRHVDLIRAIQADALREAADICRGVYGNGSNLEHAISERCAMLIAEEAKKL